MTPAEKIEERSRSRLLSILSKGQKKKKKRSSNKQHVSAAESLRGILSSSREKRKSKTETPVGTNSKKRSSRKEERSTTGRRLDQVVTDFGSSPTASESGLGKWRERGENQNRVRPALVHRQPQPHYNHYGECLPGREYNCDDIPKEKFSMVHCKHSASGYF